MRGMKRWALVLLLLTACPSGGLVSKDSPAYDACYVGMDAIAAAREVGKDNLVVDDDGRIYANDCIQYYAARGELHP